jgi:hypothetical protein
VIARLPAAAALAALLLATLGSAGSEAAPERLPTLAVLGPAQAVFDWGAARCEAADIPDLAARAFRDADGQVQLLASHHVNRRMIGPDLDTLGRDCTVVMGSRRDPRPAAFDDRTWLAAPYTFDGTTVYALVHNEYQGNEHPGRCPSRSYRKCWYNSVTLARSTDGGRTYTTPSDAPARVASLPYRYRPDSGPAGIFAPSNIVRNPHDGYFYAFVFQNRRDRGPRRGACLMRTRDLTEPASWRAWNGRSFGMRFVDPYRELVPRPARHLCVPFTPDQAESLTYNTYLERFVRVGTSTRWNPRRRQVDGFVYYAVSRDLVHWSAQRTLMKVELTYTYRCGDRHPIAYPSLIDPSSESRNFETSGRTAYLYFTKLNYERCRMTFDRDLLRIPVEFRP